MDLYIKVKTPTLGTSRIEVSFDSNQKALTDMLDAISKNHEIRFCNIESEPGVRSGVLSEVCQVVDKVVKTKN